MELGFRGLILAAVVIGSLLLIGVGAGFSSLAALGISKVRGTSVVIGEASLRAEVVRSLEDRARGLSGRTSLPEGQGMLFVTEMPERQTFWMKGMKIPVDIIWIRDHTVIGFEESVPPPAPHTLDAILSRYESPGPVSAVLEVPSGFVRRHHIELGAPVVVSP